MEVPITEEEYRFLDSAKKWDEGEGRLRVEPVLHHVYMASYGQGIALATTPWEAVVAAMNNNIALKQEQAKIRAQAKAGE